MRSAIERAVIALIALGAASALLSAPAEAGKINIAGARMSCHAADVYVGSDVAGPGFALPGKILLGSKHLKQYPGITQRLIFLHECAHQYVGADETAADCWAVRIAKRQGWLSASGIKQTCRALWHTAGGVYHLPGPERCAALVSCFDEAPSRGKRSKKASQ